MNHDRRNNKGDWGETRRMSGKCGFVQVCFNSYVIKVTMYLSCLCPTHIHQAQGICKRGGVCIELKIQIWWLTPRKQYLPNTTGLIHMS